MTTYNKQLLFKEAAKIGSLPADTPLPKMPGWSPNHLTSGLAWMGNSHLLEKYQNTYLQRKSFRYIKQTKKPSKRGW